jgi:hypothetical protein
VYELDIEGVYGKDCVLEEMIVFGKFLGFV